MVKTLVGNMVFVDGKWWAVESEDASKGMLYVSDEDGAKRWVLYAEAESLEDMVLRSEQNASMRNAMLLNHPARSL